jgi:hypothetical protein
MHVKAMNVPMIHPNFLSRRCEDLEPLSMNVIHSTFDWIEIIASFGQTRERRKVPSSACSEMVLLRYDFTSFIYHFQAAFAIL